MIFELAAACFLLGSLLTGYAAILICGRRWRKLMDEQTTYYETRILEVERKATQLGAAVLAEKANAGPHFKGKAQCPSCGSDRWTWVVTASTGGDLECDLCSNAQVRMPALRVVD